MIITYHGVEFLKVQFGDTTIAFNPVSKKSKFKNTRFGANIALISIDHPDMNGVENLSFGEKAPFVISGPGEYEIGGIFIRGYPTESKYGGGAHLNTMYTVNLEGMNLCFLGAINKVPDSKAEEELDGIDILFVPIGGGGVLEPVAAYKLALSLEPKIIIPIHYGEEVESPSGKALKTFLKEAGEENVSPIEKLTIKKKDIETKEAEIIVLSFS